jgi:hypothetical protein
MNGRIAHPQALTPWIIIIHLWLPGCIIFGWLHYSEPITTVPVEITPIWKPASSKLCVSSSRMLCFAFVLYTSLNQSPIIYRSSHKALWRSYFRLNCVLSSGVCLIKFHGQFLPTWLVVCSASNLLAISCTVYKLGGNPHKSRSSIYWIITDSSSLESFFELGLQLPRAVIPLRCRLSIVCIMVWNEGSR